MPGDALTARTTLQSAVQAASTLATLLACVATGLVWAFAAVAAGAALDGVPPHDYDSGNRFAFAVALMLVSIVCPAACLVGYAVGRQLHRSRPLSLLAGEAAAMVPAVLVATWLAL